MLIHEKIKEDQLQGVQWNVENEEKVDCQPEEVETVEVGEISNLLRSISISGDISKGLDQIGEKDNMDKKKVDAIRVGLSTIADDIEDFIDENEIDEISTTSEVDYKVSKIEELRTSYRKLYNELEYFSEASYEELYGREETKRGSCHQWRITSEKEIIWRNMLL